MICKLIFYFFVTILKYCLIYDINYNINILKNIFKRHGG